MLPQLTATPSALNVGRVNPADLITLSAMRFHACVGILPHEREVPQPLEIDLTVSLLSSGYVVDYRDLYELTRGVVSAGELLYLEGIASAVACRMVEHPGVASARVAVRKPHVAFAGPLAFAEVVVVRTRA